MPSSLLVEVRDAVIREDLGNDEVVDPVALVEIGIGSDVIGLHVDDRRVGDVDAGRIGLQQDVGLAVIAHDADRNAPDRAPDRALVMRRAERRPHDAAELAPGIDDLAVDLHPFGRFRGGRQRHPDSGRDDGRRRWQGNSLHDLLPVSRRIRRRPFDST
jgi:hypothetical protein